MHRVNQRHAKTLAQLLSNVKYPKRMKVKQIRTPSADDPYERIEIK
jgi:hypothetical protein